MQHCRIFRKSEIFGLFTTHKIFITCIFDNLTEKMNLATFNNTFYVYLNLVNADNSSQYLTLR